MLSRVAESIYWMSRYVERAENVARFIDVNQNLSLDMPVEAGQQWLPLVITTGDQKLFSSLHDEASRANVLHFLTFDRRNPNSIISCLTAARENARSVAEIISHEMWGHINRFYLMVTEADKIDGMPRDPHDFYERVRSAGQQFEGVTDTTMTHGEAWHFCHLARLLERADKTSRILDVKYFILLPEISDVGTAYDDIQWGALLNSAGAFEMYRQRHGRITPSNIVDFLILDKEFPRAVLYCLTAANDSLHEISGTPTGGFSNGAEQHLGQLRAELAYVGAESVVKHGLHEFIDALQTRLNMIGDAVFDTFFALRSPQRQVLPPAMTQEALA